MNDSSGFLLVAFSSTELKSALSSHLQQRGTVFHMLALPEDGIFDSDAMELLQEGSYSILLADYAGAQLLSGAFPDLGGGWYVDNREQAGSKSQLLHDGWHLLSAYADLTMLVACIDAFLSGLEAGDQPGQNKGLHYRSSYEELIQALPDIIYELDEQDRFTFVNEAVQLLGYRPADLIGQHYSILLSDDDFRIVDRDLVLKDFMGRKTGPMLSPKLFNERRAGARRTANLELRMRHRDPAAGPAAEILGEIISYGEISSAGAYLRHDYNEFKGTVGVIRDVTLRRKAEEMIRKLYQAVDQLRVSVFVVNHAFEIEYVNPCFFQYTGFSPTELIGQNFFSFFVFMPQRAKIISKIIQDGFEVKEAVMMPKHGGGQLWVELRLSPVRTPDGIVTHAIAIADDISQHRKLEELLETARKEASTAAVAKSKFLSAMTHELKSPVSGIITAAELLRQSPQDVERRAAVISENARSLMELLSGILDYVRSEGSAGEHQLTAVPLQAFFENLYTMYLKRAEQKGLQFNVKVEGAAIVELDPDRIGKAIQVLLDNAIKFTEIGSIGLTAMIEQKSGNVPHLFVEVRDTGPGVSNLELDTLFVPFSHNNAGARASPRGAGIGLALARNLIRALGGELRYEAGTGGGAVFTILVPVGIPVADNAEAHEMHCQILLVDDNEINLEYMKTLMENIGFSVHTAISALEALQKLESHHIDAAVLDIYMPGYSGKDLAKNIRGYNGMNFDSQMPLFAMSAFDSPDAAHSDEFQDLFTNAFAKPVDIAALGEHIRQSLQLEPDASILTLVSAEAVQPLCQNALQICNLLRELLEKTDTYNQRVDVQGETVRLIHLLEQLNCNRGIRLLRLFLEHYAHEPPEVLAGIIRRVELFFIKVANGGVQ